MKKSDKPSEYFMGVVLRAYDKAEAGGKPVTCSALWHYVVMEGLQARGGFQTMFEWDTSKAKNVNRIRTIAEVIEGFMGQWLILERDEKGREHVVAVKDKAKGDNE